MHEKRTPLNQTHFASLLGALHYILYIWGTTIISASVKVQTLNLTHANFR